MALDGIFLYSIVCELKSSLLGSRLDKINQPEKDEVILTLSGNKKVQRLLISASPTYPKINISSISKPNPKIAPMFCMVLRKYLTSSRLINIRQVETDRIIILDFETTDDFGFNSTYSLIVEIMGRHSNITLVRKRDNTIMDSIKHVTSEINTIRCLLPNIEFVYPPKSLKLNPFDFNFENFKDYINKNNIVFDDKFFSKTFTGVSSQYSNELVKRLQNSGMSFTLNTIDKIYDFSYSNFENLKNQNFSMYIYMLNSKPVDFYCDTLSPDDSYKKIGYESPSKLIEDYFSQKDKHDRMKSYSSDLLKIVNKNISRCKKKYKILTNTLEDCNKKDHYLKTGEILKASLYLMHEGDSEINAYDFYTNSNIKIKIDPNKTPSYNVQKYFKKYDKLKRAEVMALKQVKECEEEMSYLESVLTNITNSDSYEEVEEIKKELMETGYIRFRKSKIKTKPSKPMHFVSSDGIDIYVGKNNYQNDYLTLKFAENKDMWMHTKNIPGSHVIIKNIKGIPDKTLEEAASLAAYYSKARQSSKVQIDYTQVKNVRKPSGAKPGMVIYTTNKTIIVAPKKSIE